MLKKTERAGKRLCCWFKNKQFVPKNVFTIKAGLEMKIKWNKKGIESVEREKEKKNEEKRQHDERTGKEKNRRKSEWKKTGSHKDRAKPMFKPTFISSHQIWTTNEITICCGVPEHNLATTSGWCEVCLRSWTALTAGQQDSNPTYGK